MGEGTTDGHANPLSVSSPGTATPPGASGDNFIFTGAFTQAISIKVPPGRVGLAPDLKILYNSQTGNGYLGFGWTLDLGSIQRNAKDGVDYNGTDFVFAKGGSAAALTLYDPASGEYRLKIDDGSFMRFFYSGPPSQTWTICDKSGNIFHYGWTPAARQDDPSDPSRIFRWSLEKVEDPNGNYMEMNYFKDGGQIYPDRILYTGHGSGLAPLNEVRFHWIPRLDDPPVFATGFRVSTSRILRTIHVLSSGYTFGAYTFNYGVSSDSNRAILSDVQRYGNDAVVDTGGAVISGSSLPSQENDFTSAGIGFGTSIAGPSVYVVNGVAEDVWRDIERMRVGDFNGDGISDYYRVEGTTDAAVADKVYLMNPDGSFTIKDGPETWVGSGPTEKQRRNISRLKLGDFNGDGKTDVYYVEGWGGYAPDSVYLSQGDGSWTRIDGPNTWVDASTDGVRRTVARIKLGDFDGNGMTDVYYIDGWESTTADIIYLSDGNSFAQTIPGPETYVAGSTDGVLRTSARIKMGDFNGDGRTDVYYMDGWGGYATDIVYISNGNRFADTTVPGLYTYVEGNTDGVMRTSARLKFGDFNGDGMTDIYYVDGWGGWAVDDIYLSDGDGFPVVISGPSTYVSNNTAGMLLSAARIKLGDFNGDGKTDVLYVVGWGSGYTCVYLIDGEGIFSSFDGPYMYVGKNYTYGHIDIERVQVGDFGGDGMSDTSRINSSGQSAPIAMYFKNGPFPDLLQAVDNGRGGLLQVVYEPSTGYSNEQLPFPVKTVSAIMTDDGLGDVTAVSYAYSGGYFDVANREFRGFGYVRQTNPDDTTVETWFHQRDTAGDDEDFKGKPYRMESRDSLGALISESDQLWDRGATPKGEYPVFVRLAAEDTTTHIGGAPVTTSKTMTYDTSNGFLTTLVQSGPGAEDVTTQHIYANTFGDENLWRLTRTTVSGSASGTVRETAFDYQPGTGNLQTKTFLNSSGDDVTVSYTYTAEGNVETQTDGNGNVTTTWYDSATRTFPERVCLPSTNGVSHCSSAEYDVRYGVPRYSWDENGNKAENVFDAFGRVVETVSYVGNGPQVAARSATEYHDWEYHDYGTPNYVVGKVLERTEGGELWMEGREYFDGLGRSIQAISFGENGQPVVSKTFYDEMGRAWRSEGPYFGTAGSGWEYSPPAQYPWSETQYNDLGMPVTVQSPAGTSTFTYAGLAATVTDPDGRQVKTERDYLGRVIKVTEYGDLGAQYVTNYSYNAAGDLTTVTDANGNQTSMAYDDLGRKTAMTSPDMGSWTYSYDANGNLKRQTDAKGQSVTFAYDALSRVEIKAYSTSQNPVFYTYDSSSIPNGRGRVFEVNNFDVVSQVTGYDALGSPLGSARIIAGDSNTYTTTTEYDLAGRVEKSVYPDGYVVSYTYHPGTPLVSEVKGAVSATATAVTLATFTGYDALGRTGTLTHGNGASTVYSYDPSTTRLQGILSTASGGTAVDRGYQYTAAGLIHKVLDYRMGDVFGLGGSPVEFTYSYDALGRLTDETPSYGFNASSWTYDPIGNIDNRVVDGQGWNYSYDPLKAHAVAQVTINSSAYGFSYDQNGNLVSGVDLTDPANPGTRTVTWNADNLPTLIAYSGAQNVTVDFLYDGNGVRSRKTDSGGEITYYVGDHYEVTNGTATRHIFAGGMRVASISGGSVRYFHKDHLGSTSAVTDGSGTIVETADYRPFGGMRDYSGAVTTNYKFTDQEFDPESGLYNYNARFYDPAIGRFISADTLVQSPYGPQTLNRYSYTGNNPLVYVDPSGHFKLRDFLESVGTGVVAGAVYYWTGGLANPFWSAVAAGGAAGGVSGGAEGAVMGAVTGGVFGLMPGNWAMAIGITASAVTGGVDGLLYFGGGVVGGYAGYNAARTLGAPPPIGGVDADLPGVKSERDPGLFKIDKDSLFLSETKITSEYQLDRVHPVTGKKSDHLAVDMAARKYSRFGDAVYTPTGPEIRSGQVLGANNHTIAFRPEGWPNEAYLTFSHVNLHPNISKVYAYSGYPINVRSGQPFAILAPAGNFTAAHIHLQFIHNGSLYDPMLIIK